jgi:hypothetical protein
MKKLLCIYLSLFAILCAGCSDGIDNPEAKTFTFDFSTSQDGWLGGFSDFHHIETADYNLIFERTTLPAPLNTSKYALKIGGTNRSDDLFMFVKRKISGLAPNTTYKATFQVELASDAPTGAVGIGGAPDGLYIKAGAMLAEPDTSYSASEQLYLMNIDKGNQVVDGVNMYNIGTIGVANNTTQYTLINRNNNQRPQSITTDAKGELWICIGTDSAFEGRTVLYYSKIVANFK